MALLTLPAPSPPPPIYMLFFCFIAFLLSYNNNRAAAKKLFLNLDSSGNLTFGGSGYCDFWHYAFEISYMEAGMAPPPWEKISSQQHKSVKNTT